MSTDINSELAALEKKASIVSGASWVKFPKVGDSFQGTLITRRLAMSPTQQEQIVYVFKNESGIWNVAFKSNYPIHKDFEGGVVGQVFRVTLASEKPHKQKGFNPIKIFSVVTGPDLIDQESKQWLEEAGYEIGDQMPALVGEQAATEEAPADAKSPVSSVTHSPK